MNFLINNEKCPNCNCNANGNPYSDYFTYDDAHDELYCNKCGLIVRTNELPTIDDLEYIVKLDLE